MSRPTFLLTSCMAAMALHYVLQGRQLPSSVSMRVARSAPPACAYHKRSRDSASALGRLGGAGSVVARYKQCDDRQISRSMRDSNNVGSATVASHLDAHQTQTPAALPITRTRHHTDTRTHTHTSVD